MTGYNCDPHTVALDYRYVGFRECAAEVARYLVAVEGMDLQDPLRMRLLSHLQCYSAQREAAAKASLQTVPPSWPPAAPHPMASMPSFNPQPYGGMVPGGGGGQAPGGQPGDVMTSHASSATSSVLNAFVTGGEGAAGGLGGGGGGGVGGLGNLGGLHGHHSSSASSRHGPGPGAGLGLGLGPAAAMTAMTAAATSSSAAPSSSSSTGGAQPPSLSPPLLHSLPQFHATQFPPQAIMPPASHPAYSHSHAAQSVGLQHSASVKPYRPWGGELAY